MATNAKLVNLLQQIISLPDLQEIIAMTLYMNSSHLNMALQELWFLSKAIAIIVWHFIMIGVHSSCSISDPHTNTCPTPLSMFLCMFCKCTQPWEKKLSFQIFSLHTFSIRCSSSSSLCCLLFQKFWFIAVSALLKLKIIQTNSVLTQIPSN